MGAHAVRLALVLAALGTLLTAVPGTAESFDKTVAFELDKWYDLDVKEGPVTLHRIRIRRETGPVTKSRLIRPFSSEYLQEVQIQLEFSNTASRDWEADLQIEWMDGEGAVIDGHNDSENLDNMESHDLATVTMPTLKYGLKKAEKLRIRVSARPD